MILKIEAKVFGNFKIENDINLFYHPYTINLIYDSNNEIHIISVEKQILDYERFLPKVEVTENKITKIEFPNQDFLEDQIDLLRHLESFGAIDQNLSTIDWQNCSIEWINEPNEETQILLRKYSRKLTYEKNNERLLTKNWLRDTIIFRRQMSDLVLPFSFFREGANLFHSFQYQNSFISFYLMLEGFFGNNQFKNEKVKQEFKKSEILCTAVNQVIENLQIKKDKHYKWLLDKVKSYSKNIDLDGIVHVIVEQRGNLSHFSKDRSNMKNPFNDKQYESLAFITMSICIYSSIKLRIGKFKRK